MKRITRYGLLVTLLLGVVLAVLPAACTGGGSGGDEKIIISGASGRLGKLTVQALLDKGVPAKNLILVSRTPATLEEYKALGADVRFGDFSKPESLPAAYAGGTRMLLISIGLGQGSRPDAHKRAIDAAKAAGVKHVAYTSWIGAGRGETGGVSADHLATEDILRKSGIPWTFLRNSVYMNSAIPDAVAMVRDGTATIPADEYKVDFVTREDCAAAAAAVLTTAGHENKAYDITGPELIGIREIAAAASAVTGKAITVVPPADGGSAGNSGVSPDLHTDVPDLTGRPATSLQTFLTANRDKLLGDTQ